MSPAAESREFLGLSQSIRSNLRFFMDEGNIKRMDLAKRLGVSPGRVTQILASEENLTLRTLAALAASLGGRFEIRLVPCDSRPVTSSAKVSA